MVSKEEFNKYIEDLVKDDYGKMFKYLNKSYSKFCVILFVLCIFSFLGGVGLLILGNKIGIFLLIVATIGFILGGVGLSSASNFKQKCKNKYTEKIISFLFKGMDYSFETNGQISSKIFDKSQFGSNYERYCGSDKISINIANDDDSKSNHYLTLCDLNVQKIEENNDGESRLVTVYNGVFGYVEFPFEFKCVLCLNSSYDKKGVNLEKVVSEYMDFNKKIGVYSNDQIEARCILTPDVMEKLVWLSDEMKFLKMTFIDNKLFIGFVGKNLFELADVRDGKIETAFEKIYDEIEVLLNLVDEIKTNNKIFKI